jgi:sugar O-acyltransferase (sialic acid O-acetyltransferase NeuD family)
MPPLILVAASGLAREVLSMLESIPQFSVVGILDDEPSLRGTSVRGNPILGPLDAVARYPEAQLLLCAGRGSARRHIFERLAALGVEDGRYATVTDPSAAVSRTCSIGAGSILLAQSALTTDVRLARHVVVMPNATLTHDNVLEDFATICAGVSLGGSVTIGAAAYIGMNASVRERVIVGPDSTVGMAACVLNDIPAGEVWAGVPARSLTRVSPW